MSTIKYPNIKVRLVGMEGNAFAIMGRVSQALRRGGVPLEERDAYIAESKRGDYYQLLATAMAWVTCDEDDDDDEDEEDEDES
jgi:hypothetical protein